MLNKLIHTVQDAKLATVRKFSNQEYDILEEPGFLDDGFIRTKIEGLKKDYQKFDQQLESLIKFDKRDDYNQQKVQALTSQKDNLLIHIAFLASNSFNSLDFAIELVKEMKIDFSMCLVGLYYYREKKDSNALELFERYYLNHSEPLDHFLINKIYGLLLLKNQNPEKAAVFLRKAVEKRPEDLEVHHALVQANEAFGNEEQVNVHRNVIRMLGGESDVNELLSK